MHWRNVFLNSALIAIFACLICFGMAFNSPTSWFVSEFVFVLLLLLVLPLLLPLRRRLKSVSYTHLTLPTNSLV